MKKILLPLLFATSLPFSIHAKDPEQVFQIQYSCEINGCSIICKDDNEQEFQVLSQGANIVKTFNYPNGNMEFYVDKGIQGKERLMIGQSNLHCKIIGIK